MADKAINDLTQAVQITNEDLFVLQQGGTAKKLKGATLLDFVTMSVVEGEIIIPSSTAGSTKKFKLTVDDTGAVSATEVAG